VHSSEVVVRLAILLALALAGCSSMSDVQPGDGKAMTTTGKSYDQVCAAAVKVADAHFEIHEQNPGTGVIKAERTVSAFGNGAWIGIYVVPAAADAPSYRVEVFSRKKATGNIGEQGWEGKTLRDIQDVLDGRPMRQSTILPAPTSPCLPAPRGFRPS
jgi:hypothetical protein